MEFAMIPVVHFQWITDEGEIARRLVESEKPFLASIVPNLLDKSMKTENGNLIFGRIHPENNYYPDWIIKWFEQNRDNPNITWVQEGYRHCCERCFEKYQKNGGREKGGWPDPFHEHVCPDGYAQDFGMQLEVIGKGKKIYYPNLE